MTKEVENALEAVKALDGQPEALETVCAELRRLDALVHSPHTENFLEAVSLEAAYQSERWKTADPGKTDDEWFWTLGYLAGKALWNPGNANKEKRLHRIIASAAVCCNWHRYVQSTV